MSLAIKIFLVFVFYTLFQFIRATLSAFKVTKYNNDDKLILVTLDLITLYLLLDIILVMLNNHIFRNRLIFNITEFLGNIFVLNCILMSFVFTTSLILVLNKYNYSSIIKTNYENNMIKLRKLRYQGFLGLSCTLVISWLVYLFTKWTAVNVNRHLNLLILILILIFVCKYFYTNSNRFIMKFINHQNED